MRVVVRSSSLLFTVLSIILKAPISRVKPMPAGPAKKPAGREGSSDQTKGWNRIAS